MKDWKLDTTALYRNGILVLLLVSIALIVHNVFGQNGYLASRRQQKELQALNKRSSSSSRKTSNWTRRTGH